MTGVANGYDALELHTAIEQDDLDAVIYWCKLNGYVEKVDSDDCTPLHIASAKGNLSIVQVLLSKGSNVNARSRIGHTPLHLACRYGHIPIALALLIKGSDIDALDSEGNTPLHKAASNDHAILCKELVRRGADLSLSNNSSFTALHWAAYKGHAETTEALLNVGADHSLCSTRGTTPLHAACYYAHEAAVRALLKSGADGSVLDDAGIKPGDSFSEKVPVSARFEIKKLVRQRYTLMTEGFLELRRIYVAAWKELETKNMAVTQSAIEADLLWDKLAKRDEELNLSKIGARDLSEAVTQMKTALEEHRRALRLKSARIIELENELAKIRLDNHREARSYTAPMTVTE